MRRSRTPFVGVEHLESRINLSSVGGLAVPEALLEMAARQGSHGATLAEVVRMSSQPSLLSGGRQGATTTGVNAPGSLAALAGAGSVTLTWVDQSTNETGFRVYRSTDGVTYLQTASLGKNKSSYADTAVSAGVTYSYYVVAYTSSTTSAASNTATATLSANPAPAAPTGFSSSNVTDTAVTLWWSDNATNETGYRVYRSMDGVNYTVAGDLAADATSFTDSGLAGGTGYSYKVSAWNSGGESFAGNTVSVTTATAMSAATTFTTEPVTLTVQNRVSFTELRIDGTSGNDSILVTQAGGTLTITANGQATTYGSNFGDIVISGGAGDDAITVDGSVNLATLMYGGDGNNVLKNLTSGKATIVSIGRGTNSLTGNGVNTSYWANNGDTVNASTAEIALKGVNKVGEFYQPWTTNTASTDYIPRDLYGQNFKEPTDSAATTRLSGSFFGTGAVKEDINQTSLSDCYYLAPLSSLAYANPVLLQNMAVDLGDGTYAFRMYRNGTVNYVRVDGDLGMGPWNGLQNQMPGPGGNQWGCLFEKAYAYFRSGANTYSSLNWGYISQTYTDLGLGANAVAASSADTTLLNTITAALANKKPMTAGTLSGITNAPLISSHSYSIINAWRDASGVLQIQVRNPWGVDGAGSDGADDGLVVVNYTQFKSNFNNLYYQA